MSELDEEVLDPLFVDAMREIVLLTGFNDDNEAKMADLARILVRLADDYAKLSIILDVVECHHARP